MIPSYNYNDAEQRKSFLGAVVFLFYVAGIILIISRLLFVSPEGEYLFAPKDQRSDTKLIRPQYPSPLSSELDRDKLPQKDFQKDFLIEGPSRQNTSYTGTLQVEHTDDFEKEQSTTDYALITADGEKIRLEFKADEAPVISLAGATLQVSGLKQNNKITIADVNQDIKIISLPARPPQEIGVKRVAVILYHAKEVSPFFGQSKDDILRGMSGLSLPTPDHNINKLYHESSFGKMKLVGKTNPNQVDIYGWYGLPIETDGTSAHCGNYGDHMRMAKERAINDQYRESDYDSTLYITPDCSGVGLAFGNYALVTLSSAPFSKQGWGGVLIAAHELGHTFGWNHSSAFECRDRNNQTKLVTFSSNATCAIREYGDPFDRMGGGKWTHFNNFQKGRQGWIDDNSIKDVLANGSFEFNLVPQEMPNIKGLQMIRIPWSWHWDLSTDEGRLVPDQYFYLEYRKPYGLDGSLPPEHPVFHGVSIRFASPLTGNFGQGYLLDMRPLTQYNNNDLEDAPLPLGGIFNDEIDGIVVRNLHIPVSGKTPRPDHARVRIDFTADIQPPNLVINSPPDNYNISPFISSLDIKATAEDVSKIKQIIIYVDGLKTWPRKNCIFNPPVTPATCSYSWDLTDIATGPHTIDVVAKDNNFPSKNEIRRRITVFKNRGRE